MAKKNFYAVFGTSGLGVACNWAACQKAMKYLEKPGCKGTRTLNEAKYIAIKEYYPESFVTRNTQTENASNQVVAKEANKEDYEKGLKRYVEEAQNLSRFYTLPGIVSVNDFFYENGTAYIVMEYINGINLKEYLKWKAKNPGDNR